MKYGGERYELHRRVRDSMPATAKACPKPMGQSDISVRRPLGPRGLGQNSRSVEAPTQLGRVRKPTNRHKGGCCRKTICRKCGVRQPAVSAHCSGAGWERGTSLALRE